MPNTYLKQTQLGEELLIYYTGHAYRHRRGRYPDHRRREPWCGPGHPEARKEGIIEWPLPVDLATNKWTNSPAWNWAIDEPVPGFSLDDCIAVSDDTTDGVLRWKGGDSVADLRGGRIVVRFELKKASLYSFWLA